ALTASGQLHAADRAAGRVRLRGERRGRASARRSAGHSGDRHGAAGDRRRPDARSGAREPRPDDGGARGRGGARDGCEAVEPWNTGRPTGMRVSVLPDSSALARAAALDAATSIRAAVAARGSARIVAATGTSQIAFLDRLTHEAGIDWSRVELFHLDEY